MEYTTAEAWESYYAGYEIVLDIARKEYRIKT